MTSGKKWLVTLLGIVGFVVGYGAVAEAFPYPLNHGYFNPSRTYYGGGDYIWPSSGGAPANDCNSLGCAGDLFPDGSEGEIYGCQARGGYAVPTWVNSADEFNAFVLCKLWHAQSAQERTGALFIIGSVIDINDRAFLENGDNFYATYGEFATRVKYAESRGWINWSVDLGCTNPNTLYYSVHNDVYSANTCGYPDATGITFTTSDGVFRIKRRCANPLGSMPALDPKPADFSLTPSVSVEIYRNGVVVPNTAANAEPGDTAIFTYTIVNGQSADSTLVTCDYRQAIHNGHSTAAPTTALAPPGNKCPLVIPGTTAGGNRKDVAVETVSNLAADKSYCRTLTIQPTSNTNSGSTRSNIACAHVVRKPYFSVRGGDIAAGSQVQPASGTCGSVNASVIGWNNRSSTGNAGAGVQFAAYVATRIFDVATSQGNGSGSAATPAGLSFANVGTSAATITNGNFGGSFGKPSCIPNYFADLPGSDERTDITTSSKAVGTFDSGTYFRSGNLELTAGIIPKGKRVSLYVDGDVYISGSSGIRYEDNWTSSSQIPMFRLIVSGNIYISSAVGRLDGMYSAQPSDIRPNKGTIFTCANGIGSEVPTASRATTCNRQLMINGSFVAKHLQLLRTNNTVSDGTPAEIFNYGPAMWIAQPPGASTGTLRYDAISSLPPVL